MKNDVFLLVNEVEIHPAALIMPPMSDDEFEKFKEDISGNGLLEPIILFQEKVLDGRNRYLACKELEIDVYARMWEGGMDPVEYVVSKNLHRRHLSVSQRAMAAAKALAFWSQEAKERQREAGALNLQKYHEEKDHNIAGPLVSANLHELIDTGKATEKAGKVCDVSPRLISSAKAVLEKGTEEEKKAVMSGNAPASAVEKQIKERERVVQRPAERPTFNRTNDNIKWAPWSWNPVTGCRYNCDFCYAKDIAMRFNGHFEPEFHEHRLDAPKNTTPRKNEFNNVFVCSMADLFGEWVPDEWIKQVLDTVHDNPQWNFLFLTKNPKRYLELDFPENCALGATADTQERFDEAYDTFNELEINGFLPMVSFVSMEPLNEEIDISILEERDEPCINWIIIGGRSKTSKMPAFQPEWNWVEHIHNVARKIKIPLFYKPNLTVRPEEIPEEIYSR